MMISLKATPVESVVLLKLDQIKFVRTPRSTASCSRVRRIVPAVQE